MPTGSVYYRDSRGFLQRVEIDSDDARRINNVLRDARRLDQKWRARHETFTDAGLDPGQVARKPRPRPDLGNAWEGPRFSFTMLLGEGRVWHGDPRRMVRGRVECKICHRQPLISICYCLGCDRSGRDRDIPPPPLRARVRKPKKGEKGLKGGLAGRK